MAETREGLTAGGTPAITPSSYPRIHEEAFAVERVHFKKTKKRTSPKKSDPFLALQGTLPVLVAAPHSVRQVRRGKVRPSAEFTGSLAFLLHREASCQALAVKKLYGGDPDWDDPCLFKHRLGELVRTARVRAVISLHGSPRAPGADVGLEMIDGPGLPVSREIAAVLKGALTTGGIRRIAEDVAPAEGPCTVCRYCAVELGSPGLRVEISHRFRAPNRNGADYRSLFRALALAIPALVAGIGPTAGPAGCDP